MTLLPLQTTPPAGPATGPAGIVSLLATNPVLYALAIVVAGVGLAVSIRYLTIYGGLRLAKRIPTDLDDQLIRLLAGVLPLLILFGSLMSAVGVFPIGSQAALIVNRLLASVLLMVMVRVAFRASYIGLRLLGEIRNRYHMIEERTLPLFDVLATVMIVGLGITAFLWIWSINPTAWLASAGVVGIVVGFAAKDTLANLFAGIFIIADAPYKVGDFIVLDSGERGEVTRVGIRSTRVLTGDDAEVTIPNALMANQKIVNESGGRWIKSRLAVRVGVAYGTDADRVISLLEEIAARHDHVAKNPAPRAQMVALADSSVNFDLSVWIDHPSVRGTVAHELYVDVYKTFKNEGIEIPFPQREVWVRRVREEVGTGESSQQLTVGGPEQDEGAMLARRQV